MKRNVSEGGCLYLKKKIRLFLVDNLKLKESDFEVINANSDLFRAG